MIHRVNVILIKKKTSRVYIFVEINKLILKFLWNTKGRAKNNKDLKNKV